MKLILDRILELSTGGVKFLVLITTIIFTVYNFIIKSLDDRIKDVRTEVHSLRENDTKLINGEISNLNQKIDSGFSDIRNQNQVLLQHLLNRRR